MISSMETERKKVGKESEWKSRKRRRERWEKNVNLFESGEMIELNGMTENYSLK